MQINLSEENVNRNIVQKSFYEFVLEFWETVESEELVDNWHIKYLCDQLQYLAERVFNRKEKKQDLIINISPGSTKSLITSVMYTPWIWSRMPSARIIGASYTDELAIDLSRKSRDVVQSDKYRELFPEIVLRDDQNTKHHFQNTNGGYRRSVGVGGSITGFHGHFLVADDPINPLKAVSEVELKKVNIWMNDTFASRKVDKTITPTILIMQRLHQNDPTGNLLEKKKDSDMIKHICLPARLSDNVKPRVLRRKYRDGLFDPVRLPESVLKEAEAMGQYGFAGQYMQTPVPAGGAQFDVEEFNYGLLPDIRHFKQLIRFWDKAGTADGGDWTAGVLQGKDLQDRYWILDVVRGQWKSDKREKVIKNTAERDGYKVTIGVEQEPGSGGKESAENTIKNLAGYTVFAKTSTGDKTQRADPFSAQVNGGNVYLVKGAPWVHAYVEELRYFPNGTYDDQVDGSSGGFNRIAKKRKRVGVGLN